MTPSLPTLLHGLGDDLADGLVVVGGDGGDLGDLADVALDLLREAVDGAGNAVAFVIERAGHGRDGLLDAALQGHRIGAGGHGLYAFAEDGLGQNGGGGGAVAGHVAGLAGDFAHHLRAHVLKGVFQLDFLGNGDAVLGDERRTEFLFDDNVAALGAKGHFDGVGQDIDAAENCLTGLLTVNNLFCHVAKAPSNFAMCRAHCLGFDFAVETVACWSNPSLGSG